MKSLFNLFCISLACALLAGCASDKKAAAAPAQAAAKTARPAPTPQQAVRLYDTFQSAFLNGDYAAAKALVSGGEISEKLFDSHWQLAHPAQANGNVTIVFEQLAPSGEAYAGALKISVEQAQPNNPSVKSIRVREQAVVIEKDRAGKWALHL